MVDTSLSSPPTKDILAQETTAAEQYNQLKRADLSLKKNEEVSRLDFIDGIRGAAALYVLGYHSFLQVWYKGITTYLHGFGESICGILLFGHFAIAVFMVVSGFCLMLGVRNTNYQIKGGAFSFARKRFMRIMPPYYAAVALSLVLAVAIIPEHSGTHYDICVPASLRGLFANLFFIPELGGANTNHSFWSIGIETKIYCLFPMLLVIWSRLGKYWTCAVMTVVGMIVPTAVMIAPKMVHLPHFWLSQLFSLFVIGMLAADIQLKDSPKLTRVLKLLYLPMILTVCLLNWKVPPETLLPKLQWLHLLFGSACAIMMCLMKEGHLKSLTKFFTMDWLMRIGVASYSLYLIHAPLLQLFSKYATHPLRAYLIQHSSKLPPWLECALFICVAVPIIIFVSMGFAYIFEGKYFRHGMSRIAFLRQESRSQRI